MTGGYVESLVIHIVKDKMFKVIVYLCNRLKTNKLQEKILNSFKFS